MGEVSVIKLSHDGKTVASGDNVKNIYLWDSSSKNVTCNRFVFHSAKVYDLDWSSDDSTIVSGSLDRSVIVWSVPEKSKLKIFPDIDTEVVLSVSFIGDKEFICGGHSCTLRRFII